MPIKKYRRQEHEYASSDSTVSSRDTSPPALGPEPIILVQASRVYPPFETAPASPTRDQGEPNPYLEPTCLETYNLQTRYTDTPG